MRNQLSQQGQLNYAGTTHDSSNNQTWVNQFTVEASNIAIDVPGCQINFHWHTTTDGTVIQDFDTGIPFRTATEVSLISMAEDISNAEVASGHPNWGTSFDPQVWVIYVTRTDGKRNTVDFRDQATAQLVADAMKILMSQCK